MKYEVARDRRPAARPPVHLRGAVDGEKLGVGSGPSKKAAEQEAAKQALAALGLDPQPVG